MTAANSRTGLNNLASNRTSGTTAGVQNSLKKCEMCGFPLEQINVIPNPTITSSGVSNNGVNVHEWSVIRLLNYSSNSSEQLKLSPFQLMPIHLNCMVIQMLVYAAVSDDVLQKFCQNQDVPFVSRSFIEKTIIQNLDWLKHLIKRISLLSSKVKSAIAIMNIDGKDISLEQPFNNVKWLIKYLNQSLPERVKEYIGINPIVPEESNEIKITWKEILTNPFLFYIKFQGDFNMVIEEYKLLDNEKQITGEVVKVIEKMYAHQYNSMLRNQPLQTFFIMHLFREKKLKKLESETEKFSSYIRKFTAKPTLANFKNAIFSLGKMDNIGQIKNSATFEHLIKFINNKSTNSKILRRKMLNFWIAKIIIAAPSIRIPFLCYLLF